jgi:ABC-2 type transport system permease protein
MTAASPAALTPLTRTDLQPRPAGLRRDIATVAGRALRAIPREIETVLPAIFIAIFFYLVNIATLEQVTESIPGFDYPAFSLPTAVLLGVTGVTRAYAFVFDIQNGYFDRLLVTPIRRLAILLGQMSADLTVGACLAVPIIILGFIVGVRFEAGPLGVLVFIAIAALWCLAYAGFAYAIALKTGNPAAVNTSFLLFFPFLFLTTSYVPREALSGWLDTVAGLNPVTYILEGQRSLIFDGWQWDELGKALLAIGIVGSVSMFLCFSTMRGRITKGG